MNFLNDLFKGRDKKQFYRLAIIFFAGILLLVLSSAISKSLEQKTVGNTTNEKEIIKTPETSSNYEKELETRLEEALSLVEGAGKVRAMLTLTQGKETVVQQDSKTSDSSTSETDNSGGERTVTNNTSEDRTVMVKQNDGSEKPLVLKENQPKVEGVIIIAEGGNDIVVKDALTRAAQTVLGIEVHKVQVLKMRQ